MVADYIILHPSEKYTPQKMAEMAELSKQRFSSLFKINMGKSPMEYHKGDPAYNRCKGVVGSNDNINDIAYACGYEDTNYFIREFKPSVYPDQYRKVAKRIRNEREMLLLVYI